MLYIEKEFYKNLNEWEKYCKTPKIMCSSNPADLQNCEAYRNLISMGKDALPYIKEVYQKKAREESTLIFHGLPQLVIDIAGDEFKIPKNIFGKINEIKSFTIKWLEKNVIFRNI